jgi:hypothetical protein
LRDHQTWASMVWTDVIAGDDGDDDTELVGTATNTNKSNELRNNKAISSTTPHIMQHYS